MEILAATSADGTRVAAEVVGEGPPLLVVHGSISDRRRWAAVRESLAARFRLHLMDRRGRGLSEDGPTASRSRAASAGGAPAGRSPADHAPYSLAREAEDVAALAAAIGPSTPVLAHSYGATATLAALGAGAPLGPCVLYEPPAATDLGPGMPAEALAEMEAAVAAGDHDRVLELFFSRALRLKPRAIEALRADTETWAARAAVAHTLPREAREVNAHRIDTARLAGVTTPVTFLVGTVTTPALKASTADAHGAIRGSRLVELGGQGHAAMDTDPTGFVEAVVRSLPAAA